MGRKTTVNVVATSIRWIYDSVNEIQVAIATDQHIAVYRIKYIVLPIGIICPVIFRTESQPKEFFVNLLSRS